MEIKEADPKLEKHRKEVIEKYIEYELAIMLDFKEKGKSLSDYIEYLKTILWYIKDQRAHLMNEEFGI